MEPKLTVDIAIARAAITYTPVAVRLGVMEDRLSLGLDYQFNAKTDIRIEPFVTDDFSISYSHVIGLVGSNLAQVNEPDHNRGKGASITINRKVLHKSAFAFDLGYDGLTYGITGGMQKPYMGFFNPSFYQRHYLTTHIGREKFAGRSASTFPRAGVFNRSKKGLPLNARCFSARHSHLRPAPVSL